MSEAEIKDMDEVEEVSEESEDEPMEQEKKEKEEEDISGDGGIMKKILTEGKGWETPKKNADVEVHYVGTLLDGSEFDACRDRPFKFKLGVGQVIKGWDKGVATMKKGEKALFTIKPEYAYGKSGSPPKIPPDATLKFEVELLSWTDKVDVTKDGGVLKKVLTEASGWEKPKDDSKVTINYKLMLCQGDDEDAVDLPVLEEKTNFSFILGAEEVVEGLERAVESMKQGEKAWFKVLPNYGYGAKGNEALNVPANATLIYEVELLEFTKEKASWEMSTEEKIEACKKAKEEGNELFRQSKWKRAHKKYKKAAGFIEAGYSMKDEEKAEADPLKLVCHLNMAACNLKLKEYKSVLEDCKKALEIEPKNIKALFRRGQALSALDDWKEAQSTFDKALELEPDNKDVKREIALLKRKIAEQDKKDRKRYQNMFARLAAETEKTEKTEKSEQKEELQPMETQSEPISETSAGEPAPAEVAPTSS
jgi:FK506-binding protein 4/5